MNGILGDVNPLSILGPFGIVYEKDKQKGTAQEIPSFWENAFQKTTY